MRVLTTERLLLVPWQDRFRDDVARLTSDPRVYRFLGNGRPWDPGFVDQRHRAYLEHWSQHGFGWRGVLDVTSEEFLGVAALNYAGSQIPASGGRAFEIGWWLDPRYWKRGIALEAATAVRDDAFVGLRAERLVAQFQPANSASERIAARLGMRLQGEAVGAAGEAIRICVLERRAWEEDRVAAAGG